jgi:membrane protein
MAQQDAAAHGRGAERVRDIPKAGWRDIAWRVKDEIAEDNLSMIAAGVAFYLFFAMVPALAAVVSIYGLIADPQQVQQQIQALSGMLPQEAATIIQEQLQQVAGAAPGALTAGAAFSLLLTLWSVNKGTKALIESLNIVYDEQEKRGFIKLNLVSLALTLGMVVFVVVTLALVAVLPALIGMLGLPGIVEGLARWLRWPILAVVFMVVLAAFYRHAPSRDAPKWRWVSPGAVAATVLWIIGSGLLSWYISNFGNYNETYGSLGAIMILMLWFWLSAFIILLGAEVNAEMEHQTERDTTRGDQRPMGRRQAYVADTVGEQR